MLYQKELKNWRLALICYFRLSKSISLDWHWSSIHIGHVKTEIVLLAEIKIGKQLIFLLC